MLEATGSYYIPEGMINTGDKVEYSFEYPVIDSIQDGIKEFGDKEVKSLLQDILKIKYNNRARLKARTENGHSLRQSLTEEEKAHNKAKRQADKNLLALIREKGWTAEEIANM